MEERLGFTAGSLDEVVDKLLGFVEGKENIEELYRGQLKRNKEALSVFTADEDLQKAMDSWIEKGKYAKLLDLWVKGLVFDWNRLYGGNLAHASAQPRRISLPTYPFSRERYWVPPGETPIKTTSSHPIDDVPFDEDFYEQLMDEVINNTISIDSAIKKFHKEF